MEGPHSDFTSVSFLIDKKGIIRYIHPGGAYSASAGPDGEKQWELDYAELKGMIEKLLNEE